MNVVAYSYFRHHNSAYESERAGAGRGRFFVNYIRAIVRGHHAVYPDWQMWIYHDDRVMEYENWPILKRMEGRGLFKLIYMGKAIRLCESMMWRMLPIWTINVERVMCRDVDSLPTPRERRAIETWIGSGKAVSSLHDSVSHSGDILMGGMVAFRSEWVNHRIFSWQEMINKAEGFGIDLDRHGSDQQLLNALIYPSAALAGEIVSEDKLSLGHRDHPIDQLTAHIGGAYHVDPCVKWFSENPSYCPKLKDIEECEA